MANGGARQALEQACLSRSVGRTDYRVGWRRAEPSAVTYLVAFSNSTPIADLGSSAADETRTVDVLLRDDRLERRARCASHRNDRVWRFAHYRE